MSSTTHNNDGTKQAEALASRLLTQKHPNNGLTQQLEEVGGDIVAASPPQNKCSNQKLSWRLLEIFLAETLGTAMLLFFGCMSLIPEYLGGSLSPHQSAIGFAVTVTTLVAIFGHISGAHFNPAVTVCLYVLDNVTLTQAIVYVVAECLGAIFGYILLQVLTPSEMFGIVDPNVGQCTTVPMALLSPTKALVLEFVSTSILVSLVCSMSDRRNANKADSAPLKFGVAIFVLSMTVGPYTGCSMNPVRSLAPALFYGVWTGHWVYWFGPLASGLLVPMFYKTFFCSKTADICHELPLEPKLTAITITDASDRVSQSEPTKDRKEHQ